MKKHIYLSVLLLSLKTYAIAPQSISTMFKEGDYEGVLELINSSKSNLTNDQKNYLAGISAFRLYRYDLAVVFFKKIKNKSKYNDIYYLIGQSYYSMEEMQKSGKYFKKSIATNHKPDASLYYLGMIHKELGLFNKAKNYFKQIHDVNFPDINFIQAAHHQTGLLYLDGYLKTKKLSKKVIRKKVLPRLEYAIKSAPNQPLVNIIRRDINFIKSKYLNESIRNPLLLNFSQFFNYNSNVIYQSIEPTENNNSSSGLLNTGFSGTYILETDTKMKFENITNLYLNHQYHLEQKDPNIARYDGLTLGLKNQFMINKPFNKFHFPIWLSIGANHQEMNNTLSGDLTFDNRSYFIAIGNQFHFWLLKPTTELKYEIFENFTGQNDQKNLSINSILPFSFNQYLIFFLIGEIKVSQFVNTPELSNNQISGTVTHMMKFNDHQKFTTSGTLSIIDTKDMREQRGYEILISPQVSYESKINKYLNWGLSYKFEKKLSKDDETFSYEQHVASLSFGVEYE